SLEAENVTIGLVHATWGAHKFEIKFVGEQAHSGSTLMEDRRDALLGASHMIVAARDITEKFAPGELHTAVGEIQVYPNSPVVVASEATILLDLRSPSTEVLNAAAAMLMEKAESIRNEVGVEIHVVAEHSRGQNPYQDEGVELARRIANELQLTNTPV